MEDCLFCKIANKTIPADVIYEDDQVMAFLDIRPTTRGHALVIPKVHSDNLLETDDSVLSRMLPRIKKIASGVIKTVGASGFNLGCNTGPVSGQVVFHLHFHIIPRYENDGLVPWGHQDSDKRTREELAALIKQELSN